MVGINHKPEWESIWEDYELFDGESYHYYMPLYTDEDSGDTFIEESNLDDADEFVTFTTDGRGTIFELQIAPTSVYQTGEYNIKF